VLTAHSLEPLRPWKAEQLGNGYRVSSWAERDATTRATGVVRRRARRPRYRRRGAGHGDRTGGDTARGVLDSAGPSGAADPRIILGGNGVRVVNLEATACATAVVASDVGGIPEVVSDGFTGSLVRVAEQTLAVYRRAGG